MIEIVPAIVPKDFSDIKSKVDQVSGFTDFVQVDVCDGKFTPDKSWPFINDNGEFQSLTKEREGLPRWEEIDYEVHLMTESPSDETADWVRTGAARILIPIESGSDAVMDIIKEWGEAVELGLVANMETGIETLEAYFDKVMTIQLMSIDVIGHQGEPLDGKIFDRIKKLRRLGYGGKISIDGGVNEGNIPQLIEAGADRLVVGSVLWKSNNPVEILRQLKQLT